METPCLILQHVPAIEPTIQVSSVDILTIVYDSQFWKSLKGKLNSYK